MPGIVLPAVLSSVSSLKSQQASLWKWPDWAVFMLPVIFQPSAGQIVLIKWCLPAKLSYPGVRMCLVPTHPCRTHWPVQLTVPRNLVTRSHVTVHLGGTPCRVGCHTSQHATILYHLIPVLLIDRQNELYYFSVIKTVKA